MNESQALLAFAALAEPTRLAIIRHLVKAGPAGMAAGVLAETMEASPSRLSFHLSTLTEAGLVNKTRDARQMIYRVDFVTFGGLQGFLLHDCCAGFDCTGATGCEAT